jgi:hypothetical protein
MLPRTSFRMVLAQSKYTLERKRICVRQVAMHISAPLLLTVNYKVQIDQVISGIEFSHYLETASIMVMKVSELRIS